MRGRNQHIEAVKGTWIDVQFGWDTNLHQTGCILDAFVAQHIELADAEIGGRHIGEILCSRRGRIGRNGVFLTPDQVPSSGVFGGRRIPDTLIGNSNTGWGDIPIIETPVEQQLESELWTTMIPCRMRQNREQDHKQRSPWYDRLIVTHMFQEECPMNCPYCLSTTTKGQYKKTTPGYRLFRCSACHRIFNERSGTLFNYLEYLTEIVLLVVLWRLRYKLSLRDLAEMFLERGVVFTHEEVRDWEARFAPLLADQLRVRRWGQTRTSWYVDEPYVKVQGKWCYLYRAMDRDGNLVDSMLSQKRDMDAAKRFFKQTLETVGQAPECVTTDGHGSYPRAIREVLGGEVLHRCNQYLNNRLEQDHRSIKQRYYPMCGFGSFVSTARFCRAFDELRQFFRVRMTMKQSVSLSTTHDVLPTSRYFEGSDANCLNREKWRVIVLNTRCSLFPSQF